MMIADNQFPLFEKPTHIALAQPEQAEWEREYVRLHEAGLLRTAPELIKTVQGFVQNHPNHADAYHMESLLHVAQGSIPEAIISLHKATNLADQYHPLIHFQGSQVFLDRGAVHALLGDADKAQADFTHALFLDHENAYAASGVAEYLPPLSAGELYAYSKSTPLYRDYHAKIRLSRHGFLFDPVEATFEEGEPWHLTETMQRHDAAYAAWEAGDRAQAEAEFVAIFEGGAADCYFSHHHLGQLYLAAQKLDKALFYLDYAAKLDKQLHARYHADASWLYHNRGCLYAWRGEWDMAINDFSKGINQDKGNAVLYQRRADALKEKGDESLAARMQIEQDIEAYQRLSASAEVLR